MIFNMYKIVDFESIGIISHISAVVRAISLLVVVGQRISTRVIKLIQFRIMWKKIFSQTSSVVTPWRQAVIQTFVV